MSLALGTFLNVTSIEAQIVNQHHEYQDGSGFPIDTLKLSSIDLQLVI